MILPLKIGLIVDSTVSLPSERLSDPRVRVVNHHITLNNDTMVDFVGATSNDYNTFTEGFNVSTSQPNPAQYLMAIESLIADGFHQIVILTLTSRTSGAYNSAVVAKNMAVVDSVIAESDIQVIDSCQVALGHGLMTLQWLYQEPDQLTFQQTVELFTYVRDSIKSYFLVQDIGGLLAGGRINNVSNLPSSSLLRLWYCIEVREGALFLETRFRTKQKAVMYVFDRLQSSQGEVCKLAINHFGMDEFLSKFLPIIVQRTSVHFQVETISPLSLALSIHFRKGTLGISGYYPPS